jgi:hypothetical protein
MKMADINQMQAKIRELEARRAKGESVPELDRLYEKMDAMQNKGYEETKKNLSGENLVKPKKLSFAEFKDATSGEIAKSKTKIGENAAEKNYYGNVLDSKQTREEKLEKIKSARDEADNEVKRETRGKVSGLKKGGKVSSASKRADGCATKGKTRGKML